MRITRSNLLTLISAIWIVFMDLSWAHWNPYGLLNIIGFLSLIIIPGLLISLSLKIGRKLPFWNRLGQVIGFSILILLLWTLLCNSILPHLGVRRPLDQHPLIFELTAMYLVIVAWSWRRLREFRFKLTSKRLTISKSDLLVSVIPLIFIALSIMGAVSLNNGGSDIFTLIMLIGISIYICLLLLLRKKLHDNTFAWVIYMMSLSMLLMTSMRGWYITGHDIQHEYLVFQITRNKGVWNFSNFKDPYNSCLSITILPTIFYNLLHIGTQYVYKILFQAIFATVPVLIYLLMRNYLSKAKSLLAVVYFISFPTFFTDMSFLNRQEIAFLFLALMLMVIFDTRIALLKRRRLFLLFGLGMVLSHYSTTYSVLFILIVLVYAGGLFKLIAPYLSRFRIFKDSSVQVLNGTHKKSAPIITITMVAILVVFGVLWDSVFTDSSSGATNLISQTIGSVSNGFKTDARSNDVAYSLLSAGATSPQSQLKGFEKTIIEPQRAKAPAGTYYPESVVNDYPLKVVPDYISPITALGRRLSNAGINVASLNYTLKQSSAKLVQLLVLVGLVYTLVKRRFNKTIPADYFLLTVSSIVFVVLQVVLPDISVAYGVLRAFQQSLMLLGLYLVVGTFALGSIFKWSKLLRYGIPVAVALLFFLSTTSVVSQLLGGYEPQLDLNNSGQYYDEYYSHLTEIVADDWLQTHIVKQNPGADIQTNLDVANRLAGGTGIQAEDNMTPGLVKTYSYVLVGFTTATKHQDSISFSGNTLTYYYPVNFLNQNKNLIYNNGQAEIYR